MPCILIAAHRLNILIALLGIMVVLAGCTAPAGFPSNDFTGAFASLDGASAAGLAEIITLSAYDGVVYAVHYAADTNMVYAVYDNGHVVGWDVDALGIVSDYNLDSRSLMPVSTPPENGWR